MWKDYKEILFIDFYSNIRSLQGQYGEVLSARNQYLNEPRTDYNKKEQERGKELCSDAQIQAFVDRKKRSIDELTRVNEKGIEDAYFENLRKRGVDIG